MTTRITTRSLAKMAALPPLTAAEVPDLLRNIPRMGGTPGAVAMHRVAGLGMAAVPALLDGTKDKSTKVQGVAWALLSRVRSPDMVPVMLEQLNGSDAFTRIFILASLKDNGDARAVGPLTRFIEFIRPFAQGHACGQVFASAGLESAEAALAAIKARETAQNEQP